VVRDPGCTDPESAWLQRAAAEAHHVIEVVHDVAVTALYDWPTPATPAVPSPRQHAAGQQGPPDSDQPSGSP
jgi:hypothetical protein